MMEMDRLGRKWWTAFDGEGSSGKSGEVEKEIQPKHGFRRLSSSHFYMIGSSRVGK